MDDGKKSKWFLATFLLIIESFKESIIRKSRKEACTWVIPANFVASSQEPRITWLGHATFLIQINGKNILTDPIFGNLSWWFSRMMEVKNSVKDLPTIDYVILSHNHPDHMDPHSLKDLRLYSPQVKVLVPFGDKAWFDKQEFVGASEHMWWDKIEELGINFHFLPARHWSQRGLFDRNKSLWGSWMIEANGFHIYFAGDTAWGPHFSLIGKLFPSIQVALMPIGPAEPKAWMQDTHISAEQAGQAFLKLQAKYFVPMHWGTFYLGMDKFKEPIHRLKQWWEKNRSRCKNKMLHIVKVGESMQYAWQQVKTLPRLRKKSKSVQI